MKEPCYFCRFWETLWNAYKDIVINEISLRRQPPTPPRATTPPAAKAQLGHKLDFWTFYSTLFCVLFCILILYTRVLSSHYKCNIVYILQRIMVLYCGFVYWMLNFPASKSLDLDNVWRHINFLWLHIAYSLYWFIKLYRHSIILI